MMRHSLPILLLAAIACTAASAAETPDSVRVLLFASARVTSVSFVGRQMTIDGTANGGRSRTVRLDLSRVKTRIEVRATRVIAVESGGLRRIVPGRLEITREEGSLKIVAVVAVGDYLATTVAAEASPRDPLPYLTALALLQRNYVTSHAGRHAPQADLCDNTHCQLSLRSAPEGRAAEAVSAASSITMTSGGNAPCYYSVACGGSTLTPLDVWRVSEAGYSRVACSRCRSSRNFRWERLLPRSPAVDRILRGAPPPPFVDDDIKIAVGRAAGFQYMLSNTIEAIERRPKGYLVRGRGFGHRVGLCQEGARRMALDGSSAEKILRHYFPAATIRRHAAAR